MFVIKCSRSSIINIVNGKVEMKSGNRSRISFVQVIQEKQWSVVKRLQCLKSTVLVLEHQLGHLVSIDLSQVTTLSGTKFFLHEDLE